MHEAYLDFLDHLFPGDIDAEVALQANPRKYTVPEPVKKLLEEVAGCVGVPTDWMLGAAGLVVNGLAGAQCLWYLHGAHGEVQDESATGPLSPGILGELSALKRKRQEQLEKSILQGPRFRPIYEDGVVAGYEPIPGQTVLFDTVVEYDWDDGLVHETARFASPEGGPTYGEPWPKMIEMIEETRTTKMGKWLKKHKASQFLLHAFETRPLVKWIFQVSADPLDVLTMSHGRPWARTSCMRPGGAYEYGPLTDMAAGSAVLFFYRSGSQNPSGRMILRPVSDDLGHMTIVGGRTIYGDGPKRLSAEQLTDVLAKATDEHINVEYWGICDLGGNGYALSRNIYSDVDHASCKQSQEQYDEAYENLVNAKWPKPRLEIPAYMEHAEAYRGAIPLVLDKKRIDLGVLANKIALDIANSCDMDVASLIHVCSNELADIVHAQMDEENLWGLLDDDQYNALFAQVAEQLDATICGLVQDMPTHILLLPDEASLEQEYEDMYVTSRFLRNNGFNYRIPPYGIMRPEQWNRAARDAIIGAAGDKVDIVETGKWKTPHRMYVRKGKRQGEVRDIMVVADFWYDSLKKLRKKALLDITVEPNVYPWC